jgi:hypothetical protein
MNATITPFNHHCIYGIGQPVGTILFCLLNKS